MKYKKLVLRMLAATLVAASLQGGIVTKAAEKATTINSIKSGNYAIDEETSAITEYTGSEANVVVPEIINEIPVEVIGTEVFSSNEFIETVTLQPGVVLIEEGAFLNCPNLKSVTMPKGVEDIEKLSFFMCESLESIKVKSGLVCLGANAFYGCSELKEISLPNTLMDIEDYAFMDCTSLTKVAIPNGVSYIGTGAFMNCTELKEISIPNTVTDMDEDILAGTDAKIICEADSAAYKYAMDNGIEVTVVDKVENFTVDEPDKVITPGEDEEEKDSVYKINYVLKGGSISGTIVDEYDGTYSIRLPKATRKGYNFVGWYENGKVVTALKKGSTGNKTFTAKWAKVTKPSKPTISVKNVKAKKITVSLKKKISGVSGYEMAYSTSKKFTGSMKKVRFTSKTKTVKNLKKGKTYYVKVRAYKTDSTNSKVYGNYSKVSKIRIKK